MVDDHGPLGVDDLTEVVYRDVYRAAVQDSLDLIIAPPGRRPPESLMELHRWYESLGSEDQKMVRKVMAFTADSAVFGLLCLIDNVRPVTDGYRETLSLKVCSASGEERQLVPEGVELHAEFRARVGIEAAASAEG
jgi:hypothetical protein